MSSTDVSNNDDHFITRSPVGALYTGSIQHKKKYYQCPIFVRSEDTSATTGLGRILPQALSLRFRHVQLADTPKQYKDRTHFRWPLLTHADHTTLIALTEELTATIRDAYKTIYSEDIDDDLIQNGLGLSLTHDGLVRLRLYHAPESLLSLSPSETHTYQFDIEIRALIFSYETIRVDWKIQQVLVETSTAPSVSPSVVQRPRPSYMIRRKRAEETATTNETTTEDDVEAILSEEIYEEQLDRLKMFIGTSLADSQSRLAHLTDQIHQMTGYLEELQMRPEWGRLNFIYSAWNTMVDTSE